MEKVIYILHLEDDATDAELVQKMLESAGMNFKITRVQTRDEFNNALHQGGYDIILSDYKLPGYDGMSALKLVLELFPDIPFIFVSGTMGEDAAIEGLTEGATDYVLKQKLSRLAPAVKRALHEAQNQIERKRAEQQLESQYTLLTAVINSSSDIIIFSLDKDYCYTTFNEKHREEMKKVWNVDIKIGMNLLECIKIPKLRELAKLSIDRALQRETFSEVQHQPEPDIYYEFIWNPIMQDNKVIGVTVFIRDITERKRAEEKLRESEQGKTLQNQIANIFLTVPDQEMYSEVLTVVLQVMKSKFGIFGFIAENGDLVIPSMTRGVWNKCQVPDKSIIFPPDTWGNSLWGRAIREKKALYSDGPFNTPEGHIHIDQFLVVPIIFGNETLGIISVANNQVGYTKEDKDLLENIANYISPILNARLQRDLQEQERKRAEEELRKRHLAIEQNPASIIITDIQGNIEYVNPKFSMLSGYTSDEVKGKNPKILQSGKMSKTEYKQLWDTILGGSEWKGEFYNKKKDGTFYWESASISPIRDEKGSITHFVAIKEDITEKKKSEEALEEQSMYLRQLFESSPTGILLLDTQFHIVNVNKAFINLFQFTLDEVRGKEIDQFVVPESRLNESVSFSHQALESGRVIQIDTIRKKKDGSMLNVLISAYPIKIKDIIVGLYVIYVDMSERKRLQEQLIQAQKIESLGTLAAGIAHDFNNILGIVIGHAGLIESMQYDPEKLTQRIKSIQKAATRGASLVKQLLMFARKTEVLIESVRIDTIINEILKLLHETFPKTITIETTLEPDLPSILADATQIHQVLVNLCVNARDAMLNGGILSISAKVVPLTVVQSEFPLAHNQRFVQVTVADTGIGMDETTQRRIFEPFFTTKGSGKGTGLGLSIVFGVVETHKGFIDVQSEIGKGTTFNIYFPLEEKYHEWFDSEIKEIVEAPGGSETILVVEDEDMLREMVSDLLILKGYKVLTAVDGVSALEVYQKHHPQIQLVLTDMGLPRMDGQELHKKLVEIDPSVKVIITSGYLEPEIKTEILKAGIREFVQKPCAKNELLEKIREILDES